SRFLEYVNYHHKADDIPDAMMQISLVYRSQGKPVEADAWRDKLRKEHPASPAGRTAQEARPYERVVVDAFSYDAIPNHLLAQEATELELPILRDTSESAVERLVPRGAAPKKSAE